MTIGGKNLLLAKEFERTGEVKLRHGEQEIRFSQEPFPLYEGESAGMHAMCSALMSRYCDASPGSARKYCPGFKGEAFFLR
jgi:hypothetical protein